MDAQRLKIAMNATIVELSTIMKNTPQEIANTHPLNIPEITIEEHVADVSAQLQESLNLVLDARQKLIRLGYYRIEKSSNT